MTLTLGVITADIGSISGRIAASKKLLETVRATGSEARSEAGARRAAALFAHALDPCAGFSVAIEHA